MSPNISIIYHFSKEEVADAMINMFRKVHSVLTVTLDNGGEFADHARVAKTTNVLFQFHYVNSQINYYQSFFRIGTWMFAVHG